MKQVLKEIQITIELDGKKQIIKRGMSLANDFDQKEAEIFMDLAHEGLDRGLELLGVKKEVQNA